MAEKTAIEWTDATWNPTRGCTKIAQGCKNCYAETFAERWRGIKGHPYEQGFDPRTAPDKLTEPLKWRKPRRIFVDSMSDLFHETFPFDYIAAVFGVMAIAPQHTYQVLTKRPERAAAFFAWMAKNSDVVSPQYKLTEVLADVPGVRLDHIMATLRGVDPTPWPLPNVWIGTSIANQTDVGNNLPWLYRIPATVHFVSAEPLIEALDLRRHLFVGEEGGIDFSYTPRQWLDWIIVGGESGPDPRPCNVEWIRSIVGQCKAAGVPVFVKQLGANVVSRNDAGFDGEEPSHWPSDTDVEHDPSGFREEYQGAPVRIRLSKKGGEMSEWPADLRVREMPR